ncbi:EAL domain-containing protein [Halomonas sp. NPDC076908]|uniref:EAL domain-containing protein n=1 Tax=Halomonas sp. NPDC076908 TaxID=3390567 RepID=UPI003D0823DE
MPREKFGLKRFAADKIKIDISFVRDMLTSDNDRVIVATIIAMANTLGLETIAEGIESQAQASALLSMGCTQAQGYYFDRPLTAEQFSQRWLI